MSTPEANGTSCSVLQWNLQDYAGFSNATDEEVARRLRQSLLISARRPAVVAVQEIRGGVEAAEDSLFQLATACGLTCETGQPTKAGGSGDVGEVALAAADTEFHTGLMWDPKQIEFVGPFEVYARRRRKLHHALAVGTFKLPNGKLLRVGSFHATPFDQDERAAEFASVGNAMEKSDVPAVICMDGNSISAARRPNGEYVDHDPYAARDLKIFDDMDFQIVQDRDDPYEKPEADRRPTQRLFRRPVARWRDSVVLADAEPIPTTGHDKSDSHPARRIDFIIVNRYLHNAIVSHYTETDAERTKDSDHAYVCVQIDMNRIA